MTPWVIAVTAMAAFSLLCAALLRAGDAEWARNEADATSGPVRASYRAMAERFGASRDRYGIAALLAALILAGLVR